MESSTFDLVAASLRADSVDIQAFVEALATKLSESFPGRVKVERSGGILRGAKPVRKIVVELGDDRYQLDHDHGAAVCSRSAMVRGIALRTEELGLDAWIDLLSRSLVLQAETSEQGRNALARLLT
jgi:hypothetical protein